MKGQNLISLRAEYPKLGSGNVYINSRPVCDDRWGIQCARVVCKMFGYAEHLISKEAGVYIGI